MYATGIKDLGNVLFFSRPTPLFFKWNSPNVWIVITN